MKEIGKIISYSNRLWLVEGDYSLAESAIIDACITGLVGACEEHIDTDGNTIKKCTVSSINSINKIKPL